MADAVMQVLNEERADAALGVGLAQVLSRQRHGRRFEPPNVGEVRLARACRSHHQHGWFWPVWPAIDHPGGGCIGTADEKILHPERGALRQIENELVGGGAHASPTAGVSRRGKRDLARPCTLAPPCSPGRCRAASCLWWLLTGLIAGHMHKPISEVGRQ